jgi:VIT1/CCC1 family predicted Fe2+/Mn2+ transporter
VKVINNEETKFYLSSLEDERNSVYLYGVLADLEQNPKIAEIYRRLSATEAGHALAWVEKLNEAGVNVAAFKPGGRARLLAWLARRLGPAVVLPTLSAMEDEGTLGYSQPVGDKGMAATEQSHARLLHTIQQSGRGGMEGGLLAQLEGRHRTAGGNALRAAVLGANDGLVSNFSLVMGVAGAEVATQTILLTGIAGLLAGAISMALGEWISVQSSRELYEKQIRTEQREILQAPEEEAEELALIYQSRGMDEGSARQLAGQIMSNQETALNALVRDELGIDPKELGGSAWEAAITSFLLFAIGAIIPVIPYFFTGGMSAVLVSAVLSAMGLFLIGAAITLFTGRSVLYSGVRQMVFGLAAAAVTYLIGRLIGVNLGG